MNRNEGHNRNGMVLGDETRLTQILTNLVKCVWYFLCNMPLSDHTSSSNSYKFTETGGTIRVTTKLIMPGARPGTSQSYSNTPGRPLASRDRDESSEAPSRFPPNIVLTSATEQTLRHPPSPPASPIPGAGETVTSRVQHVLYSSNHQGSQPEAPTHSRMSEDLYSDAEETHSQFVPTGDPADGQHWLDDPSRIIVRMEVADTGAGISPSDVKDRKLFSQFSQAGIGRLQGTQGTGLGLSLVRRMVKLMGGRMGVDSIPDQGTTFWVELSLGAVPESEAAKERLQEAEMYTLSMPTPQPETLPTLRSGQEEVTAPSPPLSSPTVVAFGTGLNSPFNSSTLSPSPRLSLQLPPSTPQQSPQPFDSVVSIASQTPPSSTPVNSVKLKVLVVDDDITTRKLLPRLLQRHNCEVQVAEDGERALGMLGVPLFATMEPSQSRATSSSRGRKESETASSGTTNPPSSSGRPTSSRGKFPAVEPDFVPPYDRESLYGD
jgi:osomolarity two-component system sensor histidine kinase SLN1